MMSKPSYTDWSKTGSLAIWVTHDENREKSLIEFWENVREMPLWLRDGGRCGINIGSGGCERIKNHRNPEWAAVTISDYFKLLHFEMHPKVRRGLIPSLVLGESFIKTSLL